MGKQTTTTIVPNGAHLHTPVSITKSPRPTALAPHRPPVVSLAGGDMSDRKFDTDSFRLIGIYTVNYTVAPLKSLGQYDSGSFSVQLQNNNHDFDWVAYASIAAGTALQQGSTTEKHLDCSGSCYFTIESKGVSWVLTVAH
jgi:hypothetical protein